MTDIVWALGVAAAVAGAGFIIATWLPAWLACRASAKAGFNGLSRDGLPRVARLGAVAFDKQGTITTGELQVVSVSPFQDGYLNDLRWFAGALGHESDRPVGRAIARLAGRARTQHVREDPERGIIGAVDRHIVRVGTPSWLGIDVHTDVGTIVAVDVDERPLGTITVADEVISDIDTVNRHLHTAGLTPILLTRDRLVEAKDLAGRAGITEVVADVTDESRTQAERTVREQHGDVAFVADDGRSIRVDAATYGVTEEFNPLRVIAEVATIARSVPSRVQSSRITAGVLGLLAGVAMFIVR